MNDADLTHILEGVTTDLEKAFLITTHRSPKIRFYEKVDTEHCIQVELCKDPFPPQSFVSFVVQYTQELPKSVKSWSQATTYRPKEFFPEPKGPDEKTWCVYGPKQPFIASDDYQFEIIAIYLLHFQDVKPEEMQKCIADFIVEKCEHAQKHIKYMDGKA